MIWIGGQPCKHLVVGAVAIYPLPPDSTGRSTCRAPCWCAALLSRPPGRGSMLVSSAQKEHARNRRQRQTLLGTSCATAARAARRARETRTPTYRALTCQVPCDDWSAGEGYTFDSA